MDIASGEKKICPLSARFQLFCTVFIPLPQGPHEIATRMCTSVLITSIRAVSKKQNFLLNRTVTEPGRGGHLIIDGVFVEKFEKKAFYPPKRYDKQPHPQGVRALGH